MNKRSDQPLPVGISVVIPVYHSRGIIAELHKRLTATLKSITDQYEIIFVEDGGKDGSWEAIAELAREDQCVLGTQLARNFGQHNALLYGILKAKYGIIVTLDDDLQNPPEEIHKLIAKLNEGYDVVYGYPIKRQHGVLRNLASHLTKLILQNAIGAQTARHVSTFRAFRKEVRNAFLNYQSSFIFIDVLLTWGTSRFVAIPVEHHPRKTGISNYNVLKLIVHATDMLVGFSTLPLRIASFIGFLLTLFGVGILIYVLGRYWIEGGSVPGFPFLASIVAIFSGAQLFALGIIGEYIARIHFKSMGRPYSVVRDTTEKVSNIYEARV